MTDLAKAAHRDLLARWQHDVKTKNAQIASLIDSNKTLASHVADLEAELTLLRKDQNQ